MHTPGGQLQALCAPGAQAPACGCCGCLTQPVSSDNEFTHSLSRQEEVLNALLLLYLVAFYVCLLSSHSYGVLAARTGQACDTWLLQAGGLQAALHGSSDRAGATVRQPPVLSKRAFQACHTDSTALHKKVVNPRPGRAEGARVFLRRWRPRGAAGWGRRPHRLWSQRPGRGTPLAPGCLSVLCELARG